MRIAGTATRSPCAFPRAPPRCAAFSLLSREETARYLKHRCTVAGRKHVPFDAAAKGALHEMGRGNLRATDRLALTSLEVAHRRDTDVVSPAHVVEARRLAWPLNSCPSSGPARSRKARRRALSRALRRR